MKRVCPIAMAASAFLAGSLAPAGAQDAIRSDCREHVVARSRLKFDDATHALWYQHYWEGKCAGLSESFFSDNCSRRQKSANEGVDELLGDAASADRSVVLKAACKYAELVGFEWAKDNSKRCIHTTRLAPPFSSRNLETLSAILRNKNNKVIDRLSEAMAKVKEWCPGIQPPPHS